LATARLSFIALHNEQAICGQSRQSALETEPELTIRLWLNYLKYKDLMPQSRLASILLFTLQ
jgi:hypothetical protein